MLKLLMGNLSSAQSGARQLGQLFVWLILFVLAMYTWAIFFADPKSVAAFSSSVVGILGVLCAVPVTVFCVTRVVKDKYSDKSQGTVTSP